MQYFDPIQILRQNNITQPPHTRFHLAVFAEPFLSRIYSGEKTLESRITVNRIAPYGKVSPGDMVFIKRSSGPVEAVFTVGCVEQFDLTETPISLLQERYGSQLCADDAFFRSKQHCRYAILMEIRSLTRLTPFSIDKKGMQTWLLLNRTLAAQDLTPLPFLCYTPLMPIAYDGS